LPLALLSAIGLQYLDEKIKNKKNFIWILIISFLYLLIFSIVLNYVNYYQDSKNYYAYAHTEKDILNLVKEINKNDNQTILFVSNDYWPLPFYLRKNKVSYFYPDTQNLSSSNFVGYDYVIFNRKAKDMFNTSNNHTTFYLRPNVPLFLFKDYKDSKNETFKRNISSRSTINLNNSKITF
jgi:hypothetical protein